MKRTSFVLSFLFAAVWTCAAKAAVYPTQEVRSAAGYFQVDHVKLTEVTPTPGELADPLPGNPGTVNPHPAQPGQVNSNPARPAPLPPVVKPPVAFDPSGIDWNAITMIGDKVVQLIKAGKPVVDEKYNAVSAIPKGLDSWDQLQGWQAPALKVYNVQIVNGYGVPVVDVRLKVSALWGGNVDGRGKYLADVTVIPTKVDVSWGWDLDLWTENSDPVNSGTTQDPLAAFNFVVRFKTSSWFQDKNGAQDFFVTGDGKIQAGDNGDDSGN
jgi:hypothetical protein